MSGSSVAFSVIQCLGELLTFRSVTQRSKRDFRVNQIVMATKNSLDTRSSNFSCARISVSKEEGAIHISTAADHQL